MDMLAALDRAQEGASRRLHGAGRDAWSNPTPCSEWDVRALAQHLIGGNRMAVVLLDGASAEEAMAVARAAAEAAGDDLANAFDESAAAQREAFARPGALDRTVHHVVGDIPAQWLLGFRLADNLVHSWDLARALGVDASLDPQALEAVWAFAQPLSEGMRSSGRFGLGASGTLAEDAPLQDRVLDLHGRRP
ncbi:MAG TPA: TIGR03086 family metal-binding protein [Candidatus Dormibacteraeota bacterium]|jgi:uncharacterized protein (TIGR03086 family)|nr:TIGR03086 family metal-binding protein [Candidatus Dormibacteraeota bacterium]